MTIKHTSRWSVTETHDSLKDYGWLHQSGHRKRRGVNFPSPTLKNLKVFDTTYIVLRWMYCIKNPGIKHKKFGHKHQS